MLPLLLLAACKPPAADNYVERIEIARRDLVAVPLPSPDTSGAFWAVSTDGKRALYGNPGQHPLLGLACDGAADAPVLRIVRYTAADPRARAFLAMVGNGHVERLKMDARWNGRGWLWEGTFHPVDPRLEVLTGSRPIEATLPGAGTLVVKPDPLLAGFIGQCARPLSPAPLDEGAPPAT